MQNTLYISACRPALPTSLELLSPLHLQSCPLTTRNKDILYLQLACSQVFQYRRHTSTICTLPKPIDSIFANLGTKLSRFKTIRYTSAIVLARFLSLTLQTSYPSTTHSLFHVRKRHASSNKTAPRRFVREREVAQDTIGRG